MLVRGDEYYMAICNLTGLTAIYNTSLDLFISPYADGPIKFVGSMESEKKIDKITKFGKDFSIIRIPYAFKLLMQELTTLNVSMRIITDKNIDQLESMNSININSFTDFDKEMLPILTSLKSEIIQPSIPMPETPETPETQEEAIKNAASEEEPVNTTEESINQQFVKLAQVIDDNFIKTEQEQAREQLEEISLEELIPKSNSTPAISNVGVNDIINPENSLSKFQEDEMDQSGQSGQSGQSDSSGQSGQSGQSDSSGQSGDSNPSGQSGNQSKVIKLGEQ